jgi:hypothetical protein
VTESSESNVEAVTPDEVQPSQHGPNGKPARLNQALAWVAIAAGGVFILAVIFFSGFFLSWTSGGQGNGHHMGPESMACCEHMKPGHQMGAPHQMPPGGHMAPMP